MLPVLLSPLAQLLLPARRFVSVCLLSRSRTQLTASSAAASLTRTLRVPEPAWPRPVLQPAATSRAGAIPVAFPSLSVRPVVDIETGVAIKLDLA